MPGETLFTRERDALTGLAALATNRAARETAIAEAFRTATESADTEIARTRRRIGAERAKVLSELEAERDRQLADLHGRCEAQQHEAERRRADLTRKLDDKFAEAEESTRTKYKDKLWTIDSQLEAHDKESDDLRLKRHRTADDARKRIESTWTAAAATLTRVGATPEDVAFDVNRLPSATETDPEGRLERCNEDTVRALRKLQQSLMPKFLGPGGTIGGAVLVGLIAAGIGLAVDSPLTAGIAGGVGLVLGGLVVRFLIRALARKQVVSRGQALGVFQAETGRWAERLDDYAEAVNTQARAKHRQRHADERAAADQKYLPVLESQKTQYEETKAKIAAEFAAAVSKIETSRTEGSTSIRNSFDENVRTRTAELDAQLNESEVRYQALSRSAAETRDRDWDDMARTWHEGIARTRRTLIALSDAGTAFPSWDQLRERYAAPAEVPLGIRYGEFTVALAGLPDGLPADPRLKPAETIDTTVPAYLPFPDNACVLIKARDENRAPAIELLQMMMLRAVTGLPPGKVRFTIIDPVGLGENFASFMHLADADEQLVTSRIWTEPQQIEQRLEDLTGHMETVIQKYLRNQYRSIEEYNRAAGEVAEPYRILVIANFPQNFTPDAAKRLISIASSGPACGVCTLLSVDTRAAMPRDFRLADLEAVSFGLVPKDGRFALVDPGLDQFPLVLDRPPEARTIAEIVKKVGDASKQAARVEVPFSFIAPKPEDVWAGSAAKELAVPVGRAGATRRQLFRLGTGTAQHALIAGKTGSGKSTLLHALISNLALHYSPDEVELYLIDFKKGVEFKSYATHKLPHARVIAVESEREFGLSVLQRLDVELRDRGDKFRAKGANDLAGYREATGTNLPRILLIVDEFQEFFVEDDKLAQEASLLLDRLVRQGRAFGIHVILGSQTLGGAYSLARSTIDQMAVRVALQCSDADAQLILSKDNTAARLLSRPGEAIYNDANGLVEGNDPFQVVWLSEEQRDELLAGVRAKAAGRNDPPALVFEGNASAVLAQNARLNALLDRPVPAKTPVAWLGDAIAIKDPTLATFRSQSAANLLVIGQQEDAALAVVAAVSIALAAQVDREAAPLTILDGSPDDAEFAGYLQTLSEAIGPAARFANRTNLSDSIGSVAAEVTRRASGETADRSPRFLVVFGLQRFRELRKGEDDFGFRRGDKAATPADQFLSILKEGPGVGVHVIVWVDTLTNLTRALDRQALKEFGQRVLFQMSATDSSNLLDTPAASRLGRNRALFTQDDQERPEKFRPYGLPGLDGVRRACSTLRERSGIASPAAAVDA